jgi:hypothetical protein
MTLLLVLLGVTWGGLATWTYLDGRACRRVHRQRRGELPPKR